jgi:hypothetical protein
MFSYTSFLTQAYDGRDENLDEAPHLEPTVAKVELSSPPLRRWETLPTVTFSPLANWEAGPHDTTSDRKLTIVNSNLGLTSLGSSPSGRPVGVAFPSPNTSAAFRAVQPSQRGVGGQGPLLDPRAATAGLCLTPKQEARLLLLEQEYAEKQRQILLSQGEDNKGNLFAAVSLGGQPEQLEQQQQRQVWSNPVWEEQANGGRVMPMAFGAAVSSPPDGGGGASWRLQPHKQGSAATRIFSGVYAQKSADLGTPHPSEPHSAEHRETLALTLPEAGPSFSVMRRAVSQPSIPRQLSPGNGGGGIGGGGPERTVRPLLLPSQFERKRLHPSQVERSRLLQLEIRQRGTASPSEQQQPVGQLRWAPGPGGGLAPKTYASFGGYKQEDAFPSSFNEMQHHSGRAVLAATAHAQELDLSCGRNSDLSLDTAAPGAEAETYAQPRAVLAATIPVPDCDPQPLPPRQVLRWAGSVKQEKVFADRISADRYLSESVDTLPPLGAGPSGSLSAYNPIQSCGVASAPPPLEQREWLTDGDGDCWTGPRGGHVELGLLNVFHLQPRQFPFNNDDSNRIVELPSSPESVLRLDNSKKVIGTVASRFHCKGSYNIVLRFLKHLLDHTFS